MLGEYVSFLFFNNTKFCLQPWEKQQNLCIYLREKNRDKIYITFKVFNEVFSLLNCQYHLMYGIIILNSRSNCVLCLIDRKSVV